jgi:hypothetical protein
MEIFKIAKVLFFHTKIFSANPKLNKTSHCEALGEAIQRTKNLQTYDNMSLHILLDRHAPVSHSR